MKVDVQVETTIERPIAEVYTFAGNPDNVPKWYVNIESAEWQTAPAVSVGAKVAFVAHFLGRRLAYTYEIVELVPEERLVMRTADGPFPMETTYTWAKAGDDHTRMTVRSRGEPTGFGKLTAPFMAAAMRRAQSKDLERLRQLLERRGAPADGRDT